MSLPAGPDGESRDLVVTCVPVPPDLVMMHIEDVTARRRFAQKLQHQAFHDALTGLPNRAMFQAELAERRAARSASVGTVAVLFLDLDGFKEVNDSLGHGAGDALLVVVAARLQRCVRSEDLVARIGGDEFTIIVAGNPPGPDVTGLAARILAVLDEPVRCAGRDVMVSASIGIVTNPAAAPPMPPEEVVRLADIALYQAKAAGKGRAVVYQGAGYGERGTKLNREGREVPATGG